MQCPMLFEHPGKNIMYIFMSMTFETVNRRILNLMVFLRKRFSHVSNYWKKSFTWSLNLTNLIRCTVATMHKEIIKLC